MLQGKTSALYLVFRDVIDVTEGRNEKTVESGPYSNNSIESGLFTFAHTV